jgi:outer membrane protein TolC
VAPIPVPPDSIAVGLPTDLLRRRPDVRRAERELAAQTARIGVATAELWPKFGLSGFFELQASDLSDLGSDGSSSWGFTPGLRWNIFSAGKIRNQVRVEEARTEQLLYTYEQMVLRGLEEVENAMVSFEREKTRYARLAEAVAASERSVSLVHTQYISGLTNFQNYLDSQRSLFNQQDQLATSEGLVVKALIRLNKALGGGWVREPIQPGPDQHGLPDGSVIELAQGKQGDQESQEEMDPPPSGPSDNDTSLSQGVGDAD